MKMEQLSEHCYAVLNEKNRVCDANSGLINVGGGMVVDTQSDLSHARQMIEMFNKVWPGMPKRVVNTHEDADHVYGNQLFEGAEIIGHRSVPDRMEQVAQPGEFRKLMKLANGPVIGSLFKLVHPGVVAAGRQLHEDFDFTGVELVPPTTLFDDGMVIELEDMEVQLIRVGSCHQVGDTVVWAPKERVLFAGDVIFRLCTPMGWVGTYDNWFKCLDLLESLNPEVVVPGHGPVCGIEGIIEMKAYLQYVRGESRKFFDDGVSAVDAARRIDFGPYAGWIAPERVYLNIERAYREFRGEPPDKPWDQAKTFDTIYGVARARELTPVF